MSNWQRLIKALFFIILLGFGFAQPAFGQTGTVVRIEPNSVEVDPNEPFTVDVVVENVVDLWAFDVAIEYDDSVIEFDHSEINYVDSLLDEGLLSPDISEPGRAHCGMTQLTDRSEPKSGSGILCTFVFIAGKSNGETYLEVFANDPGDDSSTVGLVNGFSYLTISVIEQDGFVQVGEPKGENDTFIPLLLFNAGKAK
jgi:hypothetical protein